jgi:hypothetical protein
MLTFAWWPVGCCGLFSCLGCCVFLCFGAALQRAGEEFKEKTDEANEKIKQTQKYKLTLTSHPEKALVMSPNKDS